MKCCIDWTETGKFTTCFSRRNLIGAFEEVYGVKEFRIRFKKYTIRGSHFLFNENYDEGFHYMLSCFLTPKQIIKVYRKLCKDAK